MSYNERMQKAIASLESQEVPNYKHTAQDYGLVRMTLMRRHQGICTSREEATSTHHKLLTNTQEEALIKQINKLTARGLPLTS